MAILVAWVPQPSRSSYVASTQRSSLPATSIRLGLLNIRAQLLLLAHRMRRADPTFAASCEGRDRRTRDRFPTRGRRASLFGATPLLLDPCSCIRAVSAYICGKILARFDACAGVSPFSWLLRGHERASAREKTCTPVD